MEVAYASRVSHPCVRSNVGLKAPPSYPSSYSEVIRRIILYWTSRYRWWECTQGWSHYRVRVRFHHSLRSSWTVLSIGLLLIIIWCSIQLSCVRFYYYDYYYYHSFLIEYRTLEAVCFPYKRILHYWSKGTPSPLLSLSSFTMVHPSLKQPHSSPTQ